MMASLRFGTIAVAALISCIASSTTCSGFAPPPLPATATRIVARMKSSPAKNDAIEPYNDIDDAIFDEYDADGNGYIDRIEFRRVTKRMRSSSRRREVLSVAAAYFGAMFVASGSNTFQYAQKNLRYSYLERDAEDSQGIYFPTALLSYDADDAISRVLYKRGFTPENTLFGHSICADEVNNRKEQLIPLMVNRWQEGFALGGLAGLPFAGKSGFGAYLHHVPDDGRLLVLFAPHVGIDELGRVGSLRRDGQTKVSSACGAAVGAYKRLQATKRARPDPLLVLDDGDPDDDRREYDPQLKNIVKLLSTRLDGIDESSDSIAFVTYQMYGIIRELVTACITETSDLFDYATEVAVVGGIMINRRKGGDFFQPLSFETRRKGEDPLDLFEETFGERPNLLPIIGSKAAMARASLY